MSSSICDINMRTSWRSIRKKSKKKLVSLLLGHPVFGFVTGSPDTSLSVVRSLPRRCRLSLFLCRLCSRWYLRYRHHFSSLVLFVCLSYIGVWFSPCSQSSPITPRERTLCVRFFLLYNKIYWKIQKESKPLIFGAVTVILLSIDNKIRTNNNKRRNSVRE